MLSDLSFFEGGAAGSGRLSPPRLSNPSFTANGFDTSCFPLDFLFSRVTGDRDPLWEDLLDRRSSEDCDSERLLSLFAEGFASTVFPSATFSVGRFRLGGEDVSRFRPRGVRSSGDELPRFTLGRSVSVPLKLKETLSTDIKH